MSNNVKFLIFVLCNMFIGCLAGWLFIYANFNLALFLVIAYLISLVIFNDELSL